MIMDGLWEPAKHNQSLGNWREKAMAPASGMRCIFQSNFPCFQFLHIYTPEMLTKPIGWLWECLRVRCTVKCSIKTILAIKKPILSTYSWKKHNYRPIEKTFQYKIVWALVFAIWDIWDICYLRFGKIKLVFEDSIYLF